MARKQKFNSNQLFYLAILAFGLMLVPILLGQIQNTQYQRAMAAFEKQGQY